MRTFSGIDPPPPEEKYGDFFRSYEPERMETVRMLRQQQANADQKERERRLRRRKAVRRAWRHRALALLLGIALIVGIVFAVRGCAGGQEPVSSEPVSSSAPPAADTAASPVVLPQFTEQTATPGDDLYSPNAILIDTTENVVLASKGGEERVRPASLVKLMTALVAAEAIEDVTERYTFPYEVLNPLYQRGDAIMIGYAEGECVTLDDLFHGMLMFSGADAAYGLVDRVAESTEDFVAKMNEKARDLGLKNTLFTDPVGLDDDGHYSTCYDLAVLLQEVLRNDYLRRVISTENFTLEATEQHPDGIPLKNSMFAKMVGDEPEVAVIRGGKTGFTGKAGFCLASFAVTLDGRELIAVSTGANGSYRPIYDSFTLYKNYSSVPEHGASQKTGE